MTSAIARALSREAQLAAASDAPGKSVEASGDSAMVRTAVAIMPAIEPPSRTIVPASHSIALPAASIVRTKMPPIAPSRFRLPSVESSVLRTRVIACSIVTGIRENDSPTVVSARSTICANSRDDSIPSLTCWRSRATVVPFASATLASKARLPSSTELNSSARTIPPPNACPSCSSEPEAAAAVVPDSASDWLTVRVMRTTSSWLSPRSPAACAMRT